MARAGEQLTSWYANWAPHLPGLFADLGRLLRVASGPDDPEVVGPALDAAARRAAEQAHPEHAGLAAAADAAGLAHHAAQRELAASSRDHDNHNGTRDPADYARQVADAERAVAATAQQLTDVRARIVALQSDPAILTQPADRLAAERPAWRARRDMAEGAYRTHPAPEADRMPRHPRPEEQRYLSPRSVPGPGIAR